MAGLTITGLGNFDPVNNTGFDISGATGTAYVSEDLSASGNGEKLFLLNLTTGVLSPADGLTGTIGTTARITSIAVFTVPEPGTWALCALGLLGVGWVARRRPSQG